MRTAARWRALAALGLALLLAFGTVSPPARAAELRAPELLEDFYGNREVPRMASERPDPGDRHAVVSQGVRNLVKRAYQLTDIQWTPAADLEGWKNLEKNRFLAGETYTGLPYGQPHRSGSYVPWETSLAQFLEQAADPESPMYSAQAVSQVQQNPAPYFCCECSAFVSYAWGLPTRETTYTLGEYGTLVGNQVTDLQVGDCLLQVGRHARLVTDMTYDADYRLTGIEISEERAPAARRIWYLAGSALHPLTELQTEYLDKGYVILRFNRRDEVGYTHDCASPLEGDACPRCGLNPFTDVGLEKWYANGVCYVVNQGLMGGTEPGVFSPNDTVTRAMMVTILWRMYHSPRSQGTLPFADVREDAYYYAALRWAWTRGCVSGTGARSFSPNELCTRGQIVAVLWQAAGQPAPTRTECPFTDVKEGAYYRNAVLWAVEQGIVGGKTETSFGPNDPATRAELAVMAWRACTALGLFR